MEVKKVLISTKISRIRTEKSNTAETNILQLILNCPKHGRSCGHCLILLCTLGRLWKLTQCFTEANLIKWALTPELLCPQWLEVWWSPENRFQSRLQIKLFRSIQTTAHSILAETIISVSQVKKSLSGFGFTQSRGMETLMSNVTWSRDTVTTNKHLLPPPSDRMLRVMTNTAGMAASLSAIC